MTPLAPRTLLPSHWRSVFMVAAAVGCLPAYALNPDYAISQYVHRSWGSDAGLQAVRRLKQTPDGYLWLATRGGLVRFDGIRFTTYRAGTEGGLESSTMQDIVVNPDGSLWVGSLGGGVAHYQTGKFTSYTMRDGLPSDNVGCLYRDSHGILWVGTREGGIARMVNGRFEKLSMGTTLLSITSFLEDTDGSFWIATAGRGVFRLQNGYFTSHSVKEGIPDDRITSLYRDHAGVMWTTGWGGISYWNGIKFVGDPVVNAAVGYAIACYEDHDGNMWIASSSGLYRKHNGIVTKMDRDSGLSGDFVSDVFEDREGNLWAGTRGGLDRLRSGPVRIFTKREGLVAGLGPVLSDGSEGIWTVSSTQVARIGANRVRAWPAALAASSVPAAMLPEPGGAFLIGFENGAMHWSRGHAAIAPELAGVSVRSLLRARDGGIWIGTASRGLLHWTPGSPALTETALSRGSVATLAEDRAGAIWAGCNDGCGLYRVTSEGIRHFGSGEGLRSPSIFTIYLDSEDHLWIGSTGGLSWFQDGKIRTVNSQQGLPADQVFAILDDSYGRLWFTGYGGITAIEKKSLTDWAAGKIQTLNPLRYGSGERLQLYTIGSVFPNTAKLANGHMWFSIADGLAEVTPPNPANSTSPDFRVLTEDVTIDGVVQPEMGRLKISPGARSISLRYTALTLANPEAVRFRYRLDGNDKNWYNAGTQRTAFYGNLKPGAYTFHVSASTDGERWVDSPASVLEQLPYFYQTNWFLLLVSLTVVSLAFIFYRLHLHQAVERIEAGYQERIAERTRIAQELHDTVVQAISGSTMLVENAAEKVPDSLPVVKGALLRAVDKLDAALAESRVALKGLRASADYENSLARRLAEVANDVKHREIAFHVAATGEPRDFRPAVQYEVFRIGSEAISNALQHSEGTSVRVDLEYKGEFRLCVRDNGKGMPEDILQRGKEGHFGLEGMRERADRIGGRLEVYSRSGAGTEVHLTIPRHIAFDRDAPRVPLVARAVLRVLSRLHRNSA